MLMEGAEEARQQWLDKVYRYVAESEHPVALTILGAHLPKPPDVKSKLLPLLHSDDRFVVEDHGDGNHYASAKSSRTPGDPGAGNGSGVGDDDDAMVGRRSRRVKSWCDLMFEYLQAQSVRSIPLAQLGSAVRRPDGERKRRLLPLIQACLLYTSPSPRDRG